MANFHIDPVNGNDANDGSNWANAWKTITSGATAARIAPGDIVKIAKSPAPFSIANATWNNLSKTVTLAGARTLNIDTCENDWTNVNGLSSARETYAFKQGSYAVGINTMVTPAAGSMQAKRATGTLDLSAYQEISFWLRGDAAILTDNYVINLYGTTDASGSIIDSFAIPPMPMTNSWMPVTITKTGGGNLGSAIKSIAIVMGTTPPSSGNRYVYLDNIIATKTNDLNLQTIISKNTQEKGGTEGWYGIQSINGTTVLLDNDVNQVGVVGQGYSGATETVETFARKGIVILKTNSSDSINLINDSGTPGNYIEFQGGWDTGTNLQTGCTYFDGGAGYGYGISFQGKQFVKVNNFGFVRCDTALYMGTGTLNIVDTIDSISNCTNYGVQFGSSNLFICLSNLNNNYNGTNLGTNTRILKIGNINNNLQRGIYGNGAKYCTINQVVSCKNNGSYGLSIPSADGNVIRSLASASNVTAGIELSSGLNFLRNCTISDGTKMTAFTTMANHRLFSAKEGGVAANNFVYTDDGLISSLANNRSGGSGYKWKYAPGATRTLGYELSMVLAEFPVNANALVTVTVYCMKDHATNIGAKLLVKSGQLAGVVDAEVIKANDTNWEQLTLTFTPTEAGIIEVEALAYYIAGVSYAYFADIVIS